jgi:peptidoglycan hydrolase-like protein with peptidoglycan-binding domain
MSGNDPFLFTDEDFGWWEDPLAQPAAAVAVGTAGGARPVRRRPPPRTLARDLARIREGLAQRTTASVFLLGLFAFVFVAVALSVRIVLSGGEPAAGPLAENADAVAPQTTPQAQQQQQGRPAALLRPGKRGAAVRDLQLALGILGFHASAPDGAYGAGTGAATAAFQASRGLTADGVVGSETRQELTEAIAAEAQEDAAAIGTRLNESVKSGALDDKTRADARSALDDALAAMDRLSPGRAAVLGLALDDLAAGAGGYDATRAAALATTLAENVAALEERRPETHARGITDGTGVVYHFLPDYGYEFHPLGSFTRLNQLVRRGDEAAVDRLATALVARGQPNGKARVWEYRFPFGGPSTWTSGFAQAVGAQAFARAGALLEDESLEGVARAAYRAIPKGLSRPLGGGIWVREYGFSDMAVLNAQLQSIISLSEYVEITDDKDARTFVAEMSAAAQALLPQFDTGCWSRYSFEGNPATPSYHAYHVHLLKKLAASTGEAIWRDTGARWAAYQSQGPC